MSISFWRYKDFSDDGCAFYECLNCYETWEARTNPKYSEWKFCPYCGCEWEGEKDWDQQAKWDRKMGTPLKSNQRLCLPLFVAEKDVFLLMVANRQNGKLSVMALRIILTLFVLWNFIAPKKLIWIFFGLQRNTEFGLIHTERSILSPVIHLKN